MTEKQKRFIESLDLENRAARCGNRSFDYLGYDWKEHYKDIQQD